MGVFFCGPEPLAQAVRVLSFFSMLVLIICFRFELLAAHLTVQIRRQWVKKKRKRELSFSSNKNTSRPVKLVLIVLI